MKNLIVSESQNDITGFHKIGVLSLVFCLGARSIMPVHAITLNDDGIFGKLKVDHELIKHDDLLIEGDAVLTQSISHRTLDVGALTGGEPFEVSEYSMLLAAILGAFSAGWECFKLFAAVGADDSDLGLPVGIFRTTTRGKLTRRMEARQGAVKGVLPNTLAHLKLLAALLADASYLRGFLVNLLFAVARVAALSRAKLCASVAASVSQKFLAALFARDGDAVDRHTFAAAKVVLLHVGVMLAELLTASLASNVYLGVSGHKRNLLSDGWHVCLGHAAPTGGIHNYIRLSTNHQMQRVLSPFIIAQMEVCGNG